MPAPRIKMRKLRDVLRLRLDAGLSMRQISASTKISTGAIQKLLKQANSLNLTWPLADDLDDDRLYAMFYPQAKTNGGPERFALPNWSTMHQELKRKAMTKRLLWEEYYPTRCYSYSQFCDLYAKWCKRQKRSLRQLHKAGEKAFIDYAGLTIPIVNPSTGEILFDGKRSIDPMVEGIA